MEEYITRNEHKEYAERIDAENNRQNRRIEVLEDTVKDMHSLTVSVGKMADHMANIDREQEKQGKRLEVLESRDGEMWRKVAGYIATAVIGVVTGFVFRQIGM